jgi:hypothetical protein
MSNSNRNEPSTKDVSADAKPRLSLTRERVKDLRVRTGFRTGVLNAFQPPVIYTSKSHICTQQGA